MVAANLYAWGDASKRTDVRLDVHMAPLDG